MNLGQAIHQCTSKKVIFYYTLSQLMIIWLSGLFIGTFCSLDSVGLCLGNDLGDEDIDIGGNEPPVSSYQPVEIEKEKDSGHKNSKTSSDSSSGKKMFALLCFVFVCASKILFYIQNFGQESPQR